MNKYYNFFKLYEARSIEVKDTENPLVKTMVYHRGDQTNPDRTFNIQFGPVNIQNPEDIQVYESILSNFLTNKNITPAATQDGKPDVSYINNPEDKYNGQFKVHVKNQDGTESNNYYYAPQKSTEILDSGNKDANIVIKRNNESVSFAIQSDRGTPGIELDSSIFYVPGDSVPIEESVSFEGMTPVEVADGDPQGTYYYGERGEDLDDATLLNSFKGFLNTQPELIKDIKNIDAAVSIKDNDAVLSDEVNGNLFTYKVLRGISQKDENGNEVSFNVTYNNGQPSVKDLSGTVKSIDMSKAFFSEDANGETNNPKEEDAQEDSEENNGEQDENNPSEVNITGDDIMGFTKTEAKQIFTSVNKSSDDFKDFFRSLPDDQKIDADLKTIATVRLTEAGDSKSQIASIKHLLEAEDTTRLEIQIVASLLNIKKEEQPEEKTEEETSEAAEENEEDSPQENEEEASAAPTEGEDNSEENTTEAAEVNEAARRSDIPGFIQLVEKLLREADEEVNPNDVSMRPNENDLRLIREKLVEDLNSKNLSVNSWGNKPLGGWSEDAEISTVDVYPGKDTNIIPATKDSYKGAFSLVFIKNESKATKRSTAKAVLGAANEFINGKNIVNNIAAKAPIAGTQRAGN